MKYVFSREQYEAAIKVLLNPECPSGFKRFNGRSDVEIFIRNLVKNLEAAGGLISSGGIIIVADGYEAEKGLIGVDIYVDPLRAVSDRDSIELIVEI